MNESFHIFPLSTVAVNTFIRHSAVHTTEFRMEKCWKLKQQELGTHLKSAFMHRASRVKTGCAAFDHGSMSVVLVVTSRWQNPPRWRTSSSVNEVVVTFTRSLAVNQPAARPAARPAAASLW